MWLLAPKFSQNVVNLDAELTSGFSLVGVLMKLSVALPSDC